MARANPLISATGSSALPVRARSRVRAAGFTLVELLLALTIAGLVMALAAPASVRFYEGMQRRQAVRDTVTLLAAARERALSTGHAQDVMVRPAQRRLWTEGREQRLPGGLVLTVHGAAELNQNDVGVIRFYPDGSASGGGVDIARGDGSGTRINVDWLLGTVEQLPLGEG